MKKQLLILGPTDRARSLCARMVELGVPFPFDPPAKLPLALPKSLAEFSMIVLSPDEAARDRKRLAAYEKTGGLVWVMQERDWKLQSKLERIAFGSGLKLNDPRMHRRMERVPDEQILMRTLEWGMEQNDLSWTDVLRYHIETLLQAYELLGDEKILARAGWLVEGSMKTRPPVSNGDHVACVYPIMQYAEMTGQEKKYLPVCRQVAEDYLNNTPRYRGVLCHFASDPGMVRFETSFQACPSYARLARLTGEERYFDIAVEQTLLCDPLLIDKKTGLWRVGRGIGGLTPTVWGRGYACVLRGLLNTLDELPGDHPGQKPMRKILARMARAVAKAQEKEGHWLQLLGDASRRPEGSVTAWCTAALAKGVRMGLLGDEYRKTVEKGWLAVKRQTWDGMSVAVVQGTTASADPEYYRTGVFNRPSYSHFPMLAALERLQMQREG